MIYSENIVLDLEGWIQIVDPFQITNLLQLTLNDQFSHHIETIQLICGANQLTDFYMIGTLVVKWLIKNQLR